VCPSYHSLGESPRKLYAGSGSDCAVCARSSLDGGQICPQYDRVAVASIWSTGTCGRLYHPVWARVDPGHLPNFESWGDTFEHQRMEVAGFRYTKSHYSMHYRWRCLRTVQRV